MADEGAICFEQPLNERIRTFLRLEHLIARLRYHQADPSHWGRRATMDALLDILNVMSRYDTRGEVSKELGLRYAWLERLADRDDVDSAALASMLETLDTLGRDMQRMPPQFASYQLRDNELLNSLNNRMPIPGGSCSFDLPAYQHWLAQKAPRIEQHIEDWCRRIAPFEQAIATILRLLRETSPARETVAETGVLVHNTESGTQMIRVLLEDATVYPEISAGRHRATIRFMQHADDQLHVRQTQSPVHFRMACCRF
ncbi:cell division protein ZapD [Salinisphaera sp. T31B1]|uniref:cell division protein ZapD n=1 Tax=Salinisphaera sp. T31B1 TaxID=727963 RepID=UPI00333FB0B6